MFQGVDFTPAQLELVASKFKKLLLNKGATLLRAGQTVHNQYYICSGCLRTFFIDPAGNEHTLQFAIKDWWISDYIAYYTGAKATMTIECIQGATIYQLARADLEALFVALPGVETFFRKKMERRFAHFQQRILSNLSKTAKERYTEFVASYPNIEQQVKNYHVASYLGMKTESLSRIRREMAGQ